MGRDGDVEEEGERWRNDREFAFISCDIILERKVMFANKKLDLIPMIPLKVLLCETSFKMWPLLQA